MVLLKKGIRLPCANKCLNCSFCVKVPGFDVYNFCSFDNPDDLKVKLKGFYVKLHICELAEIFRDGFLSDQDVIRLQNFIRLKYGKVTGSHVTSGCSLNELKQSMARLQQNKANGERSISTCLAELDNSTGLPR